MVDSPTISKAARRARAAERMRGPRGRAGVGGASAGAVARESDAQFGSEQDPWLSEYGPIVDRIVTSQWEANRYEAQRAEQVAELMRAVMAGVPSSGVTLETAMHEVELELSVALQISDLQARKLMSFSYELQGEAPATLRQWLSGQISRQHVVIVLGAIEVLDEESAKRDVEQRLLDASVTQSPAQVNRLAKRLTAQATADTMQQRFEKAREDRRVCLDPAADGMAWLRVLLPAVDAVASFERTREIARRIGVDDEGNRRADEPRTFAQRQADVVRDLLVLGTTDAADDSLGRGVQARVTVTVPALTLLAGPEGDGQLAELEGYGPIDTETARDLCASAPSFRRVLTDPVTGVALALDRKSYRPGPQLSHWIKIRDKHCTAPGCVRPAHRSEVDHTIDWQYGGPTNDDNLATLCRKHHVLKHTSRWRVTNYGNGEVHWKSPSGVCIVTRPEPLDAGGYRPGSSPPQWPEFDDPAQAPPDLEPVPF